MKKWWFINSVLTDVPPSDHETSGKVTPVDNDEFPLIDSAKGYARRKITWANLKTHIATVAMTFTNKTLTDPKIYNIFEPTYSKLVANFYSDSAAVNYLRFKSRNTGVAPNISAASTGADTNIPIALVPGGTGAIEIYAGAGVTPAIAATGADSAHSLNLKSKGTGVVQANGIEVVTAKRTANTQTGTSYTLALTDAGHLVTLNNGSAIALTVPTNAVAAFPVGTVIDLAQLGAGQVTVGGAGVTLQSTPGLKISAQYGGARLTKLATDTWLVTGDLAA